MPAPELRIGNRAAYLRKAIKTPNFTSESVLTRDAFQYTELWLKRNCAEALPYWQQAEHYYAASKTLPPVSSPLTSYYCFLNAVKALLIVKKVPFVERHGVSGEHDLGSKRSLSKEVVRIQNAGIVASLSHYLGESPASSEHAISDLLANLPFIHRSYRHTFQSCPELFIPLRNVIYRKHPTDGYVWFSAEINGRFSDKRSLKTLPDKFEVDEGYKGQCIIRTAKRIKWHKHGANKQEKELATARLWGLHRQVRRHLSFISAPIDLWYLKRNASGVENIERCGITIIMAIMHRLSELSRYDPKGLLYYFNTQANWLLTEFVQLAPAQFIDELICEMTSLEFRLPGVRPY